MKILIFNKNWIGDVIFAEPLIRTVKKQFPQSHVICVSPPRCKSFLAKNPYVDEVLTFDEKGEERSLLKRLQFIFALRKRKIDRAYLVHRSYSRALMCFLAGIPERIGYDTKGRGRLLTTMCKNGGQSRGHEHDVDYFLRLAGEQALATDERDYRFYFADEDSKYIDAIFKRYNLQDNKVAVINPGANWLPKRWPVEYFARFADLFYERFSLPVVISGNEDNQALADIIIRRTNFKQCVSLCGKTTLTQLGALFARAMFVVTADSGPMHIASGVGAPVIALFGPTDPGRTGPHGVGERIVLRKLDERCAVPCYESSCKTFTCMSNISPEMVMNTVEKLLASRP
jgi:lipopolysaccharide heptosyltransferase II